MSIKSSVNDFLHRVQNLFKGGGEQALEKQKERGKLTARERVSHILDKGSSLKRTSSLSTPQRILEWTGKNSPATA